MVGRRDLSDSKRVSPARSSVFLPGEVVKRPGGIGDAPMHEGAIGVRIQRLLEALYAFLMVEAVAPVQPDIEPALRLGRGGGNGAAIGAEVEMIHA
ncbi:hypothetical protein X736_09420 [Mesorhizobium sp. L2C089B000]|nr:hypothetical protein X736_09420 [Mesorhizobium sp. L2C089B000]ESZ35085.1 hypothetical protein X732_25490 [Mesorhizobium sp. L2C066B000]